MSDHQHITDALASIGATHLHYRGVTNSAINAIQQLQAENERLKDRMQSLSNQYRRTGTTHIGDPER